MKKILSFILTAVLLLSLSISICGEEEVVGTDITASATMWFEAGEGKSAFLRDRDFNSFCTARDRFELMITSETPIHGIYLVWNTKPASWKLSSAGETISGGVYGYLHEYQPLSGGTSYVLTWEGPSDAQLAEVYLLSEGAVPDFVQTWEEPYTKADILMLPMRAGNEFLYFGGTLPYYGTQSELKVQLAYLLNSDPILNHELLNGLWYAGVRNYPVFSEFTEQVVANTAQAELVYPEEKVLDYLVETIRRFKPEVVLGPDLAGNGGDLITIRFASILTQKALTASRNTEQCPASATTYGVWQAKKCYLHLYGESSVFLNWSEKILPAFNDLTAFQVAQTAYGYHLSQQDNGQMSLDNPEQGGNGMFGLFSSIVGEDMTKNDFLENIPADALSNWVEPEPEPELPTTENDPITEPQDTTVSIPEISIPPKTPTEKSDFPLLLLYLIVAAGAVSFIGTIILIAKSGKRK